MRLRLLFPFLLLALLAAQPAQAQSQKSDAHKLRKSQSVIRWYNNDGRWTLRPRYQTCKQLRASAAEDRCYRHRTNLRWHIARVQRLRPEPAYEINHRAGWMCIYYRERDPDQGWATNTGNGYYGGLQMTWSWMGLVSGAHKLSGEQQMAAAEKGYRMSGYSRAWMAGQWPNTYPPCAGHF